jgi:hypothetical protein
MSTYDRSASLPLRVPSGLSLKVLEEGDTVTVDGNKSEWHLQNLKIEGENTHRLQITDPSKNDSWIASWEVQRGRPLRLQLGSFFGTAASSAATEKTQQTGLNLKMDYFMSDLFWQPPQRWSHLKWGVSGELRNTNMVRSGISTSFTQTTLQLLYRFTEGLQQWDSTYLLGVGFFDRRSSLKELGPSLLFGYSAPKARWSFLGEGIQASLGVVPSLIDDRHFYKSHSLMEWRYEARFGVGPQWGWLWAVSWQNENEKPVQGATSIQINSFSLNIGIDHFF